MTAATVRAFIAVLGLEDRVAEIAADAPELSDAQHEELRAIFVSNATKAAPHQAASVLTDHDGMPRHESGPL
jgi:hypothetical protein